MHAKASPDALRGAGMRHRAAFSGMRPGLSRVISRSRTGIKCYAAQEVPTRLQVKYKVHFGEELRVVGNLDALGSWNVDNALQLAWHEGDVWAAELAVPVGQDVEFKCVRVGNGNTAWENGNNRTFKALGDGYSLDVRCDWDYTDNTHVDAKEMQNGAGFATLGNKDASKQQKQEQQQQQQQQQQETSSNGNAELSTEEQPIAEATPQATATSSSDDAPETQWLGKEITFMRSNEHSNERNGVWDTTGLEGAELKLVAGDKDKGNWLGKLGVAKQVLVDDCPRLRPGLDALVPGYVYLQWVATGALACVEAGSHYRPNHHAKLGQAIFRSLEYAISEDRQGLVTLVARKVHTKLPSFGEAFTQQVPLTRIRDIAHRNDIPHDLKQEIKHTLQNKLHRNAGPEDLIATEAMLKRVTAQPGQYSDAFVGEFKTFAAELRDFFNAGSLTQVLEGVAAALEADPADAALLQGFYTAKSKLDSSPNPSLGDIMDVMHALTSVRAVLVSGLAPGLRDGAADSALAMRQKYRLGEVRCEDYFFVLLSRFMNALEAQGGAESLATAHEREWGLPLGALLLAVRHMGLGGWQQRECAALEGELVAWQKAGQFQEKDNALRLKATLERIQRLSEGYTEALLSVFPPVAARLGKALGVPPHAASMFTEAEVRAGVVFQLSKLNSFVLRAARTAAGAALWEGLVAGRAVGVLTATERLGPDALSGVKQPSVLLVARADGDEEVSAAGGALKGVVLQQELPHLSHLGVRARQERIPFATINDPDTLKQQVETLINSPVVLDVAAESVTLRAATDEEWAAAKAAGGAVKGAKAEGEADAVAVVASPVSKVTKPRVVALLDASPETCGAKAAACAQLEKVAKASSGAAAFKTPRGMALPFGLMDLALASLPSAQQQRYKELLGALESHGSSDDGGDDRAAGAKLEAACEELQALVGGLELPKGIAEEVVKAFGSSSSSSSGGSSGAAAALIARSSANVEDLAGMSGAGLYDSIPNVDSASAEQVQSAVAGVWASLFTRRAVLSRAAAGVKQGDASMAVLLQELLQPSVAFVLHTASPLGDAPDTAVVEIAPGLGETLASGTRGSAWRLAVAKGAAGSKASSDGSSASNGKSSNGKSSNGKSSNGKGSSSAKSSGSGGEVTTLAFANFSQAQLPQRAVAAERVRTLSYSPSASSVNSTSSLSSVSSMDGGAAVATAPGHKATGAVAAFASATRTVDYSRQQLSVSAEAREALGRRIGAIAALLEDQFGGAQDVEGCVVGEDVFIVQTRPQPQ